MLVVRQLEHESNSGEQNRNQMEMKGAHDDAGAHDEAGTSRPVRERKRRTSFVLVNKPEIEYDISFADAMLPYDTGAQDEAGTSRPVRERKRKRLVQTQRTRPGTWARFEQR